MKYTLAKKLHNADEVTTKVDNKVCTVIEIEDKPNHLDFEGNRFPHVLLSVLHPKHGFIKVFHYEVK